MDEIVICLGYSSFERRSQGRCFRFAPSPVKMVVYVWFNDADTLRKAGSKTDVYETFKLMLVRGVVPGSIDALPRETCT